MVAAAARALPALSFLLVAGVTLACDRPERPGPAGGEATAEPETAGPATAAEPAKPTAPPESLEKVSLRVLGMT